MLKRRDFMMAGTLLGLSTYVKADESIAFRKQFKKVETIIARVQAHMFPLQNKLPSAEETDAITFLYETISHPAYDKDIRIFIIEGAEELVSKHKRFLLTTSHKEIEKALRAYETTNYGSTWLSRIMTLTMEGMFSDPVYGANKKEIGWHKLHTYGGYPRAKGRYLKNV